MNTRKVYSVLAAFAVTGMMISFQNCSQVLFAGESHSLAQSVPPDTTASSCWQLTSDGLFTNTCGNVGVGTSTPSLLVDVVSSNPADRDVGSTLYSGAAGPHWGGVFVTREARGTQASPLAVQTGDDLGWFGMQGYDGTGFFPNTSITGMLATATENWNTSSHGSKLTLFSTPNGAHAAQPALTLDQSGNVGIGNVTNPQSALQVNGYVQIQTASFSPPPAADCSNANQVGRMIIWSANQNTHSICFCPQNIGQGFGWKCTQGN